MGRIYTSLRGKEIDMEKISIRHETIPAVGNMKINARGDELGPGGKIIRTREQVLQDYYKENPRAIQEEIMPSRKTNK
jgi:hypothetical protein